jgi:excisionase family DNA binding protein
MSNLLDESQVAEILGVSKRSVQRLVARGAIRAIRIGRCVRFAEADILDSLNRM